jgi:hypothetical protein
MPDEQINEPGDLAGVGDAPAAESDFDRGALETSLGAKMAAFNSADDNYDGLLDEVAEPEAEEATDEATDDSGEDQDFTDDTNSEDEGEEVLEVEDTDGVEESNPEDSLSGLTIPEAHVRSLKAYGYSDEWIAEQSGKLGLAFNEFALTVHGKRNAEVARWAEAGQRKREEQQGQQQQTTESTQTPAMPSLPQALQPIDLNKMSEKYGEQELLEDMLGPVNQVINQLNAVLPGLKQGMQAVERTEQNAVTTRINSFFDSTEIEPYRKLYGGSEKPLSQEQIASRNQMLDMADLILGGAHSQNHDMNFEQALTAAHDVVSADFRETAVRRTIKKEAKTRNRGITQRPSKRVAKPQSTGDDRSDLEARTAARMRNAFKNI